MDLSNSPKDMIDITVRLSRQALGRAVLNARSDQKPVQRLVMAGIILNDRRQRHGLFPQVKFGEASWDMMLELYLAHHAERRMDVSGLCAASGVPITTALRHIERLVARGYATRVADEKDGRRSFVLCAQPLLAAMDEWLDLHLGAMVDDRPAA